MSIITKQRRGAASQRARKTRAWGRKAPGQSFGDAFSGQGVDLPVAEPEAAKPQQKADRAGSFDRPTRGVFRPGRGWHPARRPPVKVFRATTDQVGGVFPFLTASPMPKTGATLGVVASTGTGFYVDPWSWVQLGLVSNPNVMVQGKPGMGKSGTVKATIRRSLRHGGRAFVPGDLKDEYAPLCREWGTEPWQVGPGLLTRINPLDPGPIAARWGSLRQSERDELWVDIRARWLMLLQGLLGAQGVRVDSTVQAAIAAVVDELTGAHTGGGNVHTLPDITIPHVFQAAYAPSRGLLDDLAYPDQNAYYDDLRPMVNALRVLVKGALKGMFDDRTNIDIDWDAPIQSLSMRRLKEMSNDEVIGVALTCANSWASGMTAVNTSGKPTYIVRDEVWRVMRLGINAIKSLDSNLRLSRDERNVEMLIMHKPSDLSSVGAAGSQEAAMAEDFWALCDTKVSLGHPKEIARATADRWGLSEQEQAAISNWCMRKPGRALWRVGDESLRVQTVLSEYESTQLFNTNDQRTEYPDNETGDEPGDEELEEMDD